MRLERHLVVLWLRLRLRLGLGLGLGLDLGQGRLCRQRPRASIGCRLGGALHRTRGGRGPVAPGRLSLSLTGSRTGSRTRSLTRSLTLGLGLGLGLGFLGGLSRGHVRLARSPPRSAGPWLRGRLARTLGPRGRVRVDLGLARTAPSALRWYDGPVRVGDHQRRAWGGGAGGGYGACRRVGNRGGPRHVGLPRARGRTSDSTILGGLGLLGLAGLALLGQWLTVLAENLQLAGTASFLRGGRLVRGRRILARGFGVKGGRGPRGRVGDTEGGGSLEGMGLLGGRRGGGLRRRRLLPWLGGRIGLGGLDGLTEQIDGTGHGRRRSRRRRRSPRGGNRCGRLRLRGRLRG